MRTSGLCVIGFCGWKLANFSLDEAICSVADSEAGSGWIYIIYHIRLDSRLTVLA